MADYIMAQANGRTIPKEDKIFGISNRAKAMIAKEGRDKVVNATIGALLDDDGKLVVLSSVADVFRTLAPEDYAEYAPIGGIAEFKTAIRKAAFFDFEPKSFTEVVATPGGTGGIRDIIGNYSKTGDAVLTSDWYWANYKSIAGEIGRTLETYTLLNEEGTFNKEDFSAKLNEILAKQDSLVIIINTPAHNPTGYSMTLGDWDCIIDAVKEAGSDKKITLYVDVAYIDFAGDESEYRKFLPKLEGLPENILPVIGYSASKTFTLYGMRCGAMICMAPTAEIAAEFKQVCEFSARASWSNSPRAAQKVIAKIYEDEDLLAKVNAERAYYRDLLIKRGKAFEQAASDADLEIVPFDAGFFASVPCDNPDEVSKKLEAEGIFLVPLAKGLRVSVASVSEARCREIPAKIKAAMK